MKSSTTTEPIPQAGALLTPNGSHRRAAAAKSGAKMIPAIVIPEPEVAYQILALNTEKGTTFATRRWK